MIRIQIADQDRRLDEADANWINEQIRRRQAEGLLVCVQIQIDEPGVNLRLRTPTCGPTGGGGRPANPRELEVMQMWDRLGLNLPTFTAGNVVAFTKQLPRAL